MTPDIVQWVVSQGIGAVLALVMFLVYRKDSRAHAENLRVLAEKYAVEQASSAKTWMESGKELGQLMARTAGALERIEERLDATETCPVSHVTGSVLKQAGERGLSAVAAGQVGAAIEDAVREVVVSQASRQPREGR